MWVAAKWIDYAATYIVFVESLLHDLWIPVAI